MHQTASFPIDPSAPVRAPASDPATPRQPELFDWRYYRVWYRIDRPPCRETAVRCDEPCDVSLPDTYAAFSRALSEQGIANLGVVSIIETDYAFVSRYWLV